MSNTKRNIWRKLVLSYIVVSLLPLIIAAYMAVNLIHSQIEEQAKITLDKNLDAVGRYFYQRLGHIHFYLTTLSEFLGPQLYEAENDADLRRLLIEIKERDHLSFLTVVESDGAVISRANSDLRGDQVDRACEAATFSGSCFKGVAILDCLFLESENLAGQAMIYHLPEEYSQANQNKRGIALAATVPIRDGEGQVQAYLLGGELLNNNVRLVDEMAENWQGNVAIFLDNLRVVTSLRTSNGDRTKGTVLSPDVAEVVLNRGSRYLGHATLSNTPYLTAYDPIVNASGDVIGAIFLGIPEGPFLQIKKGAVAYFLSVAVFGIILALFISYFITRSIRNPLQQVSQAMRRVQSGDFSHRFKE